MIAKMPRQWAGGAIHAKGVWNIGQIVPDDSGFATMDKLQLIRVRAERMDLGQDIALLRPQKAYCLPTPYDIAGAGRALMEAMEHAERDAGK